MCPSDPFDPFDPSFTSTDKQTASDKLAAELNAADPERLAQITNCGVAIREFLLSLMKVSRMDSGVMYGGFVMAVADIFPGSFHELARDVARLRIINEPDATARALPHTYVTAQDIRNGVAAGNVGIVSIQSGLSAPNTTELRDEVRRYAWGRKVQDLKKKAAQAHDYGARQESYTARGETIRDIIDAGAVSWGEGWYDRWEKEVAETKAAMPPKPTPGPFDKFNTAYPDRWPFGCDPALCMIFHDLVTARHYTTSFTDVTPNVIIRRIHWALNNYPTPEWATKALPWTHDEMRRTLDEMFKVPSLPSGIQKNLSAFAQILDIYLAQWDAVAKLRKYDMDIANSRSAKDRVVARGEKGALWVSSNKSWGNDWSELFEYGGSDRMLHAAADNASRARMEHEIKTRPTVAEREDAVRDDLERRGLLMNSETEYVDVPEAVETKEENRNSGEMDAGKPIEPHLLSDADRDAMIPKQKPYDPND